MGAGSQGSSGSESLFAYSDRDSAMRRVPPPHEGGEPEPEAYAPPKLVVPSTTVGGGEDDGGGARDTVTRSDGTI